MLVVRYRVRVPCDQGSVSGAGRFRSVHGDAGSTATAYCVRTSATTGTDGASFVTPFGDPSCSDPLLCGRTANVCEPFVRLFMMLALVLMSKFESDCFGFGWFVVFLELSQSVTSGVDILFWWFQ